ncbi:MAG: M15 family metallopeptidase [Rhizobiales bacterium]|nr:M15 family metallopeptidase [Hyphomicrobiales bacterium]
MIRPIIVAASICTLAPSAHAATIRASSGATAKVADRAAGPFQCLVNKLEETGYRIHFMGGYRRHGSRRQSLHPAGLALDINQYARNVTRPRMPRSEIDIANSCGLISGAQWASGDSGHFQLGGWSGNSRRYAKRQYRRTFARMP